MPIPWCRCPLAQAQYDGLTTPKRMVVVKGAGHSTFVDRCQPIYAVGGLAQFLDPFPDLAPLLEGTGDGCAPGNTDPVVAGELINHVMIAQYRLAFGDDRSDVSLDAAYLARTFPVAFGSEQADPPQVTAAPAPPVTGTLDPTVPTTAAPTP